MSLGLNVIKKSVTCGYLLYISNDHLYNFLLLLKYSSWWFNFLGALETEYCWNISQVYFLPENQVQKFQIYKPQDQKFQIYKPHVQKFQIYKPYSLKHKYLDDSCWNFKIKFNNCNSCISWIKRNKINFCKQTRFDEQKYCIRKRKFLLLMMKKKPKKSQTKNK